MQKAPTAAGALLALLVLAGAGAGAAVGQPSAGTVAGAALGTGLATWRWWRERRRIGR